VKRYRVPVSFEAQRDLFALYDWIENLAGEKRARSYLQRLRQFTQSLETAPERGRQRNDIRSAMRVIGFERRVTIVFATADDRVFIVRYFGFGRNWEDEFESSGESQSAQE
jgi:toxin ParE1/3/4